MGGQGLAALDGGQDDVGHRVEDHSGTDAYSPVKHKSMLLDYSLGDTKSNIDGWAGTMS